MSLTPDELQNFHVGFEFFDPFGRGRMRYLIWNYRLTQTNDEAEITKLKEAFDRQGEVVDKLTKMKIDPTNELKNKIAQLESDLYYANTTIDSLINWSNYLEGLLKKYGIELLSNGTVIKKEESA